MWSDIPNDRMLRWDECDGSVSTFRAPAGYTNGHTVDRQGRLVSCEHLARRVTRTEIDGTITVLADRYQGKRLNSPNDVVVRSDGSIWFTDPSYGIDHDYEGLRQERELDGCHVYRIDPATAEVTRVADDFARPNGLAFSPDESRLYIADSGRDPRPRRPAPHPRLRRRRRPDADGRRGVRGLRRRHLRRLPLRRGRPPVGLGGRRRALLRPDGTLIGKIRVPETVSNVCFGGPHRNRLFITATTSLYSVYLLLRGAATIS